MSEQSESPAEAYFAKDAYARELGVELVSSSPGSAHVRLGRYDKRHFNGVGTLHGAILFALADIAFAAACHSHGRQAIGIQTHMSFLAAAAAGPIDAFATELSCSRKLSTYDVQIRDREGKRIAVFQGTAYLR